MKALSKRGVSPLALATLLMWQTSGWAASTNAIITAQNGPYSSVWRQRGASSTWDAVWTGPSTITTVMEGSVQGNQVIMRRISSSDGVICEYRGTLGADGITVSGTQICPGISAPWNGRYQPGGGLPAPGTAPAPQSLTGPWVHSANSSSMRADNQVIVMQDGNRILLQQTYKTNGKWVTLACQGNLSGRDLRMPCNFAPGGNPFGFATFALELRLSDDGNHLDGMLRAANGSSQESHYSRLP